MTNNPMQASGLIHYVKRLQIGVIFIKQDFKILIYVLEQQPEKDQPKFN